MPRRAGDQREKLGLLLGDVTSRETLLCGIVEIPLSRGTRQPYIGLAMAVSEILPILSIERISADWGTAEEIHFFSSFSTIRKAASEVRVIICRNDVDTCQHWCFRQLSSRELLQAMRHISPRLTHISSMAKSNVHRNTSRKRLWFPRTTRRTLTSKKMEQTPLVTVWFSST